MVVGGWGRWVNGWGRRWWWGNWKGGAVVVGG